MILKDYTVDLNSFGRKMFRILIFGISNPTVKSRKSRTLFINYDFRWLMVAEIY